MGQLDWREWKDSAGADRYEIHLSQFEITYCDAVLFLVEFKIDAYYSGVRGVTPNISISYVSNADEDRYSHLIAVPKYISTTDAAKELCEKYLQDMLGTLHIESNY